MQTKRRVNSQQNRRFYYKKQCSLRDEVCLYHSGLFKLLILILIIYGVDICLGDKGRVTWMQKKIPNKLWGKFHGIMSLLLSKRIYFFKLADFASMGQINIFNLDYFAT